LKKTINSTLIKNYLTIRYNPKDKPSPTKKLWNDFETKFSDPNGKKTESLLLSSVKSSIPDNDEPIGLSLSSGIDSSLTLALLRKSFPKRKIIGICAVFENGFDESKQAKKIAENFEADFHTLYIDSIFKAMPQLISIVERPRWNTYTHYVTKEAKKYCKIYLTGDGADEIFGGYTFRYQKFLDSINSKDNTASKISKYLDCHNRDWVPDQEKIFHKSLKFDWKQIFQVLKPYFDNPLSPLEQVFLADYNGKLLYDFIPTSKKILEHYNLTGTSLFLNSDVVSFSTHLSSKQKFDHKTNVGKIILRKIAKKYGVKHINQKQGFSPNLLIDWNLHGREITKSYLFDSNCNIYKSKIINHDWVISAFKKVDDDGDVRSLYRLVSILALEVFFKIFKTKELKPSSSFK